MKKCNQVLFSFLLIIGLAIILQSCHKSYVWGHKDAATRTKFRSDTYSIKNNRR